MILELSDGKQIVVSSDLGQMRLSLWANRGCLGVELPHDVAEELGLSLYFMARKAKRALAPIETRKGGDVKQAPSRSDEGGK
jgi:hypothetical protein